MAMRASPKAGSRKKVRCPSCTALFAEPTKAVFECPICACRLTGNGGNALMESLNSLGMGRTGNDGTNKMQSPIDPVKKERNGLTRDGESTDFEQDSVASYHSQGYKKGEQESMMEESSQNLENGITDDKFPVDSNTTEGTHGKNGMLGLLPPVKKPGNSVEGDERGQLPMASLPLPLSVGVKKEAASVGTTGQHSSDEGSQENYVVVREESREAGSERQDGVINGGGSINRHLQAQMFRTSRCEFSFKYSVVGGSPLQSDGGLQRKKSPPRSKIGSLEEAKPNADTSDMPLCKPLRVKISHSHEESSDPSEHGRVSFGSETDSDATSGSDFDFPAPWAVEGPHDIVLPAPFKGKEAFHPNLETVASSTPHQLELLDVDEILDHEEITESGNHLKVHDTKLSSQEVENGGGSVQSEDSHFGGLSQMDENRYALLNRSEITITESQPIASHDQSIDAGDLASYVSSSMHLSAVGNHEFLVMKERTLKVNGPGSQEDCTGGEEQEGGLKGNTYQNKLKNTEPFMNGLQPEAARELLGAPVTSDSQQVLKMNGSANGTQGSADGRFVKSASTGTLWTKQSPPQLNHADSSAIVHTIPNTEKVRHTIPNTEKVRTVGVSEKGNHWINEGLSSIMHKIEHSNDVLHEMDGRTANHPEMGTYMMDAEMEQDLYKLPMPNESYANDLYPAESSRSALWAEEEESSPLAFSDDRTSELKLYHEKMNIQKSLYGKTIHGSLGSGVGQLFMPGEVRNLRRSTGVGASREASLQAASEHVDWDQGHIVTKEGRSHHADLYGNPGSYTQLGVFPSANSHSYAGASHPSGIAASSSNSQIYSYQLPAQSLMHPAAAFQNHALSHHGYHAVPSACILCSYHQHPHLPAQHICHCGACCSPSSSVGHDPGRLVEHWNCHQSHFGPPSSCAGSLVDSPLAYSSANQIQSYTFPCEDSRSQARAAKKYPPYPNDGAAPYIACKGCTQVLQVPSRLPLCEGSMQKLRCGSCGKVTRFSARGVVSNTFSREPDSMGGSANVLLQRGAYGSHSKQLPISSATEIIKSSYKHDMIKGNPILHSSNQASPHTRSPEQHPPVEELRRVQPRGQVMDASADASGQHDLSISASTPGPGYLRNATGLTGAMSPRIMAVRPADSFGFERPKGNQAAPHYLSVDEKEEGLDFGAPRISDGDSLDHCESRMRSPECNQAGRETPHVNVSQGAALRGQVSDCSEDDGSVALERQRGSPLHTLLDQESTRFRLNLEPRLTIGGPSPALDSAGDADALSDCFQNREQDIKLRSHGSPSHHFVSKGQKYIAGLLRRSLRDFGKGGGK